MTRLGLLCGSVLLVAACSGGTPMPSPTTAPTSTPAPTLTPASAPTERPTPTPVEGVGICPTGAVLTVPQFTEADHACFGGEELTIRGWLDGPPDIGFEGPLIEPTWVAYPADGLPTLWASRPIGPGRECPAEPPSCALFFLHVNPASGLDLRIAPREIIVTGHLDDPAAATCHYTYPDDWTDAHLDDAQAVASCRGQFIVVSFTDVP